MSEKTLAVVGVILWLVIVIGGLVCSSGCALTERIGAAIGNIGRTPEQIVPAIPKEQLWETIKGLTPNWLAIPVIALGAVAMFNDAWKLGMSFVIFGSVNLFMALATSRFGFWMALCGLIGSMAAVVMSVLVKNKAIKEMIFGIQNVKKGFVKDGKDDLAIRVTNAQSNIQAKSTKKIVAKIKNKAKLIGEM